MLKLFKRKRVPVSEERVRQENYFNKTHETNLRRKMPDDIVLSIVDLTNHHVYGPCILYCVVRNYTENDYNFSIDGIYSYKGEFYSIRRFEFESPAHTADSIKLNIGENDVDASSFGDESIIPVTLDLGLCKLNIKSNVFNRHSDCTNPQTTYVYVSDCLD